MYTNKYFAIAICLSMLSTPGRVSAQWENTGDVRIVEQSVQKAGDSLQIGLKIDLTDLNVRSSLAVEIIPLLSDAEERIFRLPNLLVTGRTRHILFQRLPKKEKAGQQEVRRNNNKEQYADYTVSIPYEKWMGRSSLSVALDLCGCGWDALASKRMDVTNITINGAADYVPALAYKVPEYEAVKQRKLEGRAFLDFPVNETIIYPEYRKNPRELNRIRSTIDSVRDNRFATITAVGIKGYASPEGSYSNNIRLAKGRAQALLNYVRGLYNFGNAAFTVEYEPEDWEGFRRLAVASDLLEKAQVLAIIDGTDAFDVRERKLMQIGDGSVYRFILQEWFPALRHSDYTVRYTIRNFTVEEAKELLHTDPKQLSLEEMYRVAQTYDSGSEAFNDVFDIAVHIYPNDPVANLNAANAALMRRDSAAARKYLDRVPDCGEKLLAQGALALYEGNREAATEYFEQAKAVGMDEADTNLQFIRHIP